MKDKGKDPDIPFDDNNKGYNIKKNDILKLGRMKFKVKEFMTHNSEFNAEEDLTSEFCEVKEVQPPPESEEE